VRLVLPIILLITSAILGQTVDRTQSFGKNLDPAAPRLKAAKTVSQTSEQADPEVIRVQTDLVVSDVLVTDRRGKVITGLNKSDFVITENGVRQDLAFFAGTTGSPVPRSVVLIIDRSFSMKPFVSESVAAAKEMIDKLAAQDRVAIVTDDIQLLTDYTSDKKKLKAILDEFAVMSLKKTGLSLQLSSLVATLKDLFDDEDLRPIVIMQSDGDEYWSFKPTPGRKYAIPPETQIPQRGCNGLCQSVTYEDVHALVSRSRATIYSIVPGYKLLGLPQKEQREIVRNKFLKRFPFWAKGFDLTVGYLHDASLAIQELSTVSGGHIDFIEEPADARRVYANLFETVSKRYSIGYYPESSSEPSGSWRTVNITVRNHPEYILTGRKRFFIN
jgi:VWFA-related protein